MSKLLKKLIGKGKGGSDKSLPSPTSTPSPSEPFMAPHDVAKLNRRNDVLNRLRSIPLRPSYPTFSSVAHDYVEHGLGTIQNVVSKIVEVHWLECNTDYCHFEVADAETRYRLSLDGWLMERLVNGNWEDFRPHSEIPSSLYVRLIGRVNYNWERFAIDTLLKTRHDIHREVLRHGVNDHPDLESLIHEALEEHVITRNGEQKNLLVAMEQKFGIDGFGGFMQRAHHQVYEYARRYFIDGFRNRPPETTRHLLKDIFRAVMEDHVSELAQDIEVHRTVIEQALLELEWFKQVADGEGEE